MPLELLGSIEVYEVDPSSKIVVITGLVALAAVGIDGVWRRARNVITIVHEGGHAVAALVTGRRLTGIRLHSDTSGLTLFRFGQPATDHLDLVRAYGFDVTGWEGFAVLRRVRELKLVTSVVPVLRTNPRVAGQFAARLTSLRSPDASQVWERY
jgi:hypothetical protein